MSRKYASKNNFFNSAYRGLALTVAGATLASSLSSLPVNASSKAQKKPSRTYVLSDGDHTSRLYAAGPIVDWVFDIKDPNANYSLDSFKTSEPNTTIQYRVVSGRQGLDNIVDYAKNDGRKYFTTTGITWFEDPINFLTNYPVNHGKPGYGVRILEEDYKSLEREIESNNKITQRDIESLSDKVKDGILTADELVYRGSKTGFSKTDIEASGFKEVAIGVYQVAPGVYALERSVYQNGKRKAGVYQFFRVHDFSQQLVLNPLPKKPVTMKRIPSDGGVTSLYDLDIKRTPSSIPVYRYKEVTVEPVLRGTIQDLLKDTTQVYQPKSRERPAGIQVTPFEKTPVFQPKVQELVTAQPDTTKNHTLRNIGIGVVGLGFLAAIVKAFSGGKDKKGDGIRGGETGGDGIE